MLGCIDRGNVYTSYGDVLTMLQGVQTELKHLQERITSLIKWELLKKEIEMGSGMFNLSGLRSQDGLGKGFDQSSPDFGSSVGTGSSKQIGCNPRSQPITLKEDTWVGAGSTKHMGHNPRSWPITPKEGTWVARPIWQIK